MSAAGAGGNETGARPPDSLGAGEPGVVAMHEPIVREFSEPQDGYEPTPLWLVFLCLALVGFGGWYLGTFSAEFGAAAYDEKAHGPAAESGAPAAPVDPLVLGKRVYMSCLPCHQAEGQGVAGTYPPLAGSELVAGDADALIRIVLHGLLGPLTVKGQRYDNVMPAWPQLRDEQIAAVLTYVRASWGNAAPPVDPALVASVREATRDRRSPYTYAEVIASRAGPPIASSPTTTQGAGDATGGVRAR